MSARLLIPPAIEPITLPEAKAHLRIDSDHEDALIAGKIRAAREQAEERTRRALITQTWQYTLPAFPVCRRIDLPRPPLQSVESIHYYTEDGTEHALDSSSYLAVTAPLLGAVVLAPAAEWPTATLRPYEGVVITYVAGYGDGAGDVPESIREWMLMHVGESYERRETVTIGAPIMRSPIWPALLEKYKVPRF
jgi:uncharacterized phiE125 gp8 family phage protein